MFYLEAGLNQKKKRMLTQGMILKPKFGLATDVLADLAQYAVVVEYMRENEVATAWNAASRRMYATL